MCGIYGEWTSESGQLTGRAVLGQMTGMMRRRGPDDEGLWSDCQYCQLGFRRLSILDLSPTGRQPMSTADGKACLVFNGELYNYRELRRELEAVGRSFRSSGDTEVVLQALAQWGREALARFNGMFALGFYDVRTRTLLLARDHAGIKPLYYGLTRQGLLFASQYDQVLQHPWTAACGVSTTALALYVRLGYVPAPYAMLEGTRMLEPGTWLERTVAGGVTSGRFFEFPRTGQPELRGQEAVAAVDDTVRAAVRRQMVSDVPVGCFLSGGIDSPLVAAEMASTSGALPAFTIGTGGDRFDETADAAGYARELNHRHIVEHLTPERATNIFRDFIAASAEPLADLSGLPTLFLSELASRHVKVVLSGDGGDELFWGYAGRFMAALSRAEQWARPDWVARLRRAGRRIRTRWQGTPSHDASLGEWFCYKHSRIRQPWLGRLFADALGWPSEFQAFDYAATDRDSAAYWLRWNEFTVHLPRVLQKVDRASMHYGLEVRVPLLDRQVIEVAAKIDWASCLDMATGVGKLPLRQALGRHVAFQSQRKRGFTMDVNAWMRGPLRRPFEEHVLLRQDVLGVPLQRHVVEQMFREHAEQRQEHGQALWTLLVLCVWADVHYANRRTAVAA